MGNSTVIYNVTTKVDLQIAVAWLQWLKEHHIKEMVATGCFTHAVILQLTEVDESDGLTYAVQFYADSQTLYNRYITEFSSGMQQDVLKKWGDKVISFRSVLRVIN